MGQPSYAVATRLRLGRAQLAQWRPTWSWVRGVVRAFVTSFLALTASLWFLPGVQVERGAESVASLAVLALALGALLRPLITRLTVLTGVLGLLLAGLLAQALVLWLALNLVPTVRPFSFGEVVVASWAAAVAAACVNWLVDTSSDEVFPRSAARPGRPAHRPRGQPRPRPARRAARRRQRAGAAAGDRGRQHADAVAVDPLGHALPQGLAHRHAGDHARGAGRAAARRRPVGAGLPVVRQGAWPAAHHEPPGRRGRGRGAAVVGRRAAARRRRERLEHLQRRRTGTPPHAQRRPAAGE